MQRSPAFLYMETGLHNILYTGTQASDVLPLIMYSNGCFLYYVLCTQKGIVL